ncbi:16S rRNA (cytidine(1402)-2'-O)-methyltransferase [Nanoarchaeota archaeon]
MLYIISTPIGNLGDITYRAVETLKEVDVIAAEDTRRTKILLKHYGIEYKQLISYHDFNKEKVTPNLVNEMIGGKSVAVVSDSGTPGISDPGFYLVRAAIKQNIQISPIPGANAAISALVCSGLPTDKFVFLGFITKKPGQKKKFFEDMIKRNITSIFYESPHRIKKTLSLMAEVIPEKQVVIGRELTKKFEEFIRGNVSEVNEIVEKRNLKGEFVIVVY